MNYTKNLKLPQWVPSDPIRMDDFNDAMKNIESGVDAAASKADAAQSTADRALANAGSGGSSRNYLTGTYIGTGKERSVFVSFEPAFVIVCRADANGDNEIGMVGAANQNSRIRITSTGFMLFAPNPAHPEYPDLNKPDKLYEYIAIG